jgi:hypothetical protein
MRKLTLLIASLAAAFPLGGACADTALLVSVPEQRIALVQGGAPVAQFPVSTSRFGLGDMPHSYATPLGNLQVAAKVGGGAPLGAVFKGCRPTGEILRPNAPGRDPIVTRILHLRGVDNQNGRAFDRGIFIHGTPVEAQIGKPASYGCIRMRSRDVVAVFDAVNVGTKVRIVNLPLQVALKGLK